MKDCITCQNLLHNFRETPSMPNIATRRPRNTQHCQEDVSLQQFARPQGPLANTVKQLRPSSIADTIVVQTTMMLTGDPYGSH
jgi:hypothetical protein